MRRAARVRSPLPAFFLFFHLHTEKNHQILHLIYRYNNIDILIEHVNENHPRPKLWKGTSFVKGQILKTYDLSEKMSVRETLVRHLSSILRSSKATLMALLSDENGLSIAKTGRNTAIDLDSNVITSVSSAAFLQVKRIGETLGSKIKSLHSLFLSEFVSLPFVSSKLSSR